MQMKSMVQTKFVAAAVVATLCMTSSVVRAQTASATDLTGSWQGTREPGANFGGKEQQIVLKVAKRARCGRAGIAQQGLQPGQQF